MPKPNNDGGHKRRAIDENTHDSSEVAPDEGHRRPVRSNRGTGGQLDQLARTSEIVGAQLFHKVAGHKRTRNQLEDTSVNLPDNDLAPPAASKRQRKLNQDQTADDSRPIIRRPVRPDSPLKPAPVPELHTATNNSQIGFRQYGPKVDLATMKKTGRQELALVKSNGYIHDNNKSVNDNSNDNNDDDDPNDDNTNNNNYDDESNYSGSGNGNDKYSGNSNNLDANSDKDNKQDDDDNDDDNDEDNDNKSNSTDDENGYPEESQPQPEASRRPIRTTEDERAAEAVLKGGSRLRNAEQDPEMSLGDDSDHVNVRPQNSQPLRRRDNHRQHDRALVPVDEHNDVAMGNDTDYNVLEQHHQRNRPNRAPGIERLAAAAGRQQDANPEHDADGQVSDEEEETQQQRAPRHSKSNGAIRPDTLAYYKGSPWKTVLERAKVKYRRFISLYHAFPTRDDNLDEAEKILTDTIVECRDEGFILEDAYQHSRDMDCLVFKEGANFRGALKKVAANVVKRAYSNELEPEYAEGGSQRDYATLIKRNVEALLNDAAFLKDGFDDQDRTNNLAHPSIRQTCLDFFYAGKNSLAAHFPADFQNTVPDHVIALIIAVIKHCLEEYSSGYHRTVDFTCESATEIFNGAMDIIQQIRGNPYHGAKYDSNCRRWAQAGMNRLNPHNETIDHGLRVALD